MDLDEEAAQSLTDSAGFITKQDFMKFAKDRKLVDFDDRRDKEETTEWAPREQSTKVIAYLGHQLVTIAIHITHHTNVANNFLLGTSLIHIIFYSFNINFHTKM